MGDSREANEGADLHQVPLVPIPAESGLGTESRLGSESRSPRVGESQPLSSGSMQAQLMFNASDSSPKKRRNSSDSAPKPLRTPSDGRVPPPPTADAKEFGILPDIYDPDKQTNVYYPPNLFDSVRFGEMCMAIYDTRKIWDTEPQWESKTFFMRTATGVSTAVPEKKSLVLPQMTRILLKCQPKTGLIDGRMRIFYSAEITAAFIAFLCFILSYFAMADDKMAEELKTSQYRMAIGLGAVNLIVCLLAIMNTLPDSWVSWCIGSRSLHADRSYIRFIVEVVLTIGSTMMVFGAVAGGGVCLTPPAGVSAVCNAWDRATCQEKCYPNYYPAAATNSSSGSASSSSSSSGSASSSSSSSTACSAACQVERAQLRTAMQNVVDCASTPQTEVDILKNCFKREDCCNEWEAVVRETSPLGTCTDQFGACTRRRGFYDAPVEASFFSDVVSPALEHTSRRNVGVGFLVPFCNDDYKDKNYKASCMSSWILFMLAFIALALVHVVAPLVRYWRSEQEKYQEWDAVAVTFHGQDAYGFPVTVTLPAEHVKPCIEAFCKIRETYGPEMPQSHASNNRVWYEGHGVGGVVKTGPSEIINKFLKAVGGLVKRGGV